ncbi:MAG: DUF6371 domain-containing protein [Mucilaginibacter sp.]
MTNKPMNHRYTLEPYKSPKSRHVCPQCGDKYKTFSRYIDTQTLEYLGDAVGRCSREHNCGYHYTPRQHFENHVEAGTVTAYHNKIEFPLLGPSIIHSGIVKRTFSAYDKNNLVQWLCRQFGHEKTFEAVDRYHIGTSNHWPGAAIFWQLDATGKARTGKIMLYDAAKGKRVKQPFNHIKWVHKLEFAGYYLKQCLFGEHLLAKEPDMPVAIVESEKTALIASICMPEYIWLATGSLHNLNAAICQVLKGRKVTLYPDVNAYPQWQQKAADLQLLISKTRFVVSDMLELNATEQERFESWDLGDYLVG